MVHYFVAAKRTGIVLLLLLGSAAAAVAQGELGTITGTLKDAQGGVMPGVTATAVNVETNVKTTAISNESGVYLLPSLVNGRYRLTCTLDGFAPVARELELRSGDRLRVDLTLTIGGITEETRVVAETPLLETATATRSQVIDQQTIETLPLAGRNPYSAAYTIAGVTTQFTRASISARPFDNGGMDVISINGGRSRSNELLLDGAPNTSREGTSQGSLAFVPSPDAVQEVRVSTNTYDAQFGRTGGGVIAVSIRSGTNTFRGTAYYNVRDAALNSNLYENTVRGIPKDELFHYNPGFTVGRPVLLPKVRRPQPDVLLLRVRGVEVRHPGVCGPAGANRPRTGRQLLAVGGDDLRPADLYQWCAAGVPRQHHSGQPHRSGRRQPDAVTWCRPTRTPTLRATTISRPATRDSTPTLPE